MRFRMIARTTLAAALAAALLVPMVALAGPRLAAPTATTAAARPSGDGNNSLPGASIGATATTLNSAVSVSDPWDVYKLPLAANEQLHISFRGKGGQAFAFLLPPNSKQIDPSQAVAMGVFENEGAIYPQVMRFSAKQAGTYSLVVFGAATYTVTMGKSPGTTDDDAPGVARTEYTTGDLSAKTDWSDVYAAELTTGQALSAELTKPADADFQIQAFGPDSSTVFFTRKAAEVVPWPLNAIAGSAPVGQTTQRLVLEALKTGTYYVQTAAFAGDGDYALSTKVLDPTRLDDVAWASPVRLMPSDEVTVTGRLVGPQNQPVAESTVFLQRWDAAGSRWLSTGASATTTADGGFSLTQTLARTEQLRVRYSGEFNAFAPVATEQRAFPVHAVVGTPYAPAKARRGKPFTVTGVIAPRHKARTRPVTVKFQRKVGSKWVTKRSAKPTVFDSAGISRYRFRVSLPAMGTWRVIAYHAGDHAPTTSGADFVKVR